MQATTLIDGLCFAEGPRWYEGRLWFSDMHDHTVFAADLNGQLERIVEVPNQPSGLGWLPDGRLIIVSMLDRKLLVFDNGALEEYADLHSLASYHCNDMVVDRQGRCYVGNFGYDLYTDTEQKMAELILVDTDSKPRIVATDMSFPNGAVITPDGKTLIVGETMAACLSAFNIEDDGSLTNRRIWAQLDKAVPDGICLDEQGGIWVASPISNEALRVVEGGEVTDRVKVENQAFACILGGEDGKRLFILTAGTSEPEACRATRSGKIEMVDVKFAAAGLP